MLDGSRAGIAAKGLCSANSRRQGVTVVAAGIAEGIWPQAGEKLCLHR